MKSTPFFGEATSAIVQKIEKFTKEGSGWMIDKCNTLFLNIAKYEPLKGSSYIPLPEVLAHKKAIINVKNQDQECLRWALRSALFPAKNNLNSPYSYPKQDNLNMEGIDFPTPISQINKIERQNNIALNVYGYERAVVPYHISGQPTEIPRIKLLLLHDKQDNYHYCWIKHLSRLLFDQNKHKGKTYFCDRCLYGFSREDLLINHKDECYGINDRATKIQMPAPGEKIKFKNYHKQMQVPFVIYADFESIIKPYQAAAGDKSEIKSKHQACGFGYQIVRYDGASSNVRIYRGEDAGEQFLKSLHQEVININANFAKPKPLHMSEKNEKDFQSATQCWICQKEFNDDKNPKVRDHCHILDQYRGPAHKICNTKLAIKPWITPIPVVFHNLKGYDSHLIMQQNHKITGRLSCIPNNTEKYISFSVGQLKFLDSFQFMGSSLAKLVDATDKDDFKITLNSFNPHPMKKRLYGTMGSENSRPIILRESIDKQKLAYILKHPSQFEFGTDFRNGQNKLGLLKTYFSMLNQNGERLMPYKQRNGFGRYWTAQTFGIQNMSRRIRHTICKDSMVDIDMKNAHPTLLSWYCHKHGIKCEALDKYIKSREPMLQDLVNCRHITRDEAKKFLLAIMNGKQINLQPGDPPWLISYYAGMRNIIRAVVQLNPELYELAKQSKYNHYNLEGSTINHLLCGLENKALMAAFDYLNGKGIEVAVLVFDGLMIYKNDVTDIAGILQGCSSSVNQVLEGCDIEFTVKEMDEGYDITSPTKPTNQPVDINLLLQKGIYPYEYMDSFDRFQETELPPIGKFYSSLSDESISKKDYQHAQEVWKTFNCENLGDYHDLYLKTDVTLLADVIQTFRRACMNAYKLDPLNYYTAPGLSWDALLKYTAIELELLTDYDQHLFIEKGMRGGISMASKRHARANNPGVPGYDPSEEHNHIMYYDLYGWAMSQPLPYSGFKWVDKPPAEPGKGCILEVDLEYPAELHESHNDYPLAPEGLKVKKKNGYPGTKQTFLKTIIFLILKSWCQISWIRLKLRPKMYSILRADERLIKKAKGVKKYVITKQINFANYKDALFNQKTYSHEMNMLRSQKHQIYGLSINKTTLSPLDTKRWIAPDGITTYAFGYRQEQ